MLLLIARLLSHPQAFQYIYISASPAMCVVVIDSIECENIWQIQNKKTIRFCTDCFLCSDICVKLLYVYIKCVILCDASTWKRVRNSISIACCDDWIKFQIWLKLHFIVHVLDSIVVNKYVICFQKNACKFPYARFNRSFSVKQRCK